MPSKQIGSFSKVNFPEDHVGYWLRYVSNNVAFVLSQKLETKGVTVAEWVFLRQMYLQGWTSPMDMAYKTGLTQGAISKLMDRLLNKGLLVKETSSTDRRYKRMKLTPAGQRLIPSLAKIVNEIDDQFFGKLSLSQKKRMIDFLKDIVSKHALRKPLSMQLK